VLTAARRAKAAPGAGACAGPTLNNFGDLLGGDRMRSRFREDDVNTCAEIAKKRSRGAALATP